MPWYAWLSLVAGIVAAVVILALWWLGRGKHVLRHPGTRIRRFRFMTLSVDRRHRNRQYRQVMDDQARRGRRT